MRRVHRHNDQVSRLELSGHEQGRMDRLQTTAADGDVVQQHGAWFAPGVTRLLLELDDAQLRLIAGGTPTNIDDPFIRRLRF